MKKIVMIGTVLLPSLACAATDCRVVEYPDHYEAICMGDGNSGPVSAPVAAPSQPSVSSPPVAAPQGVVPSLPQVHRQGRPPRTVTDAARTERNKMILEEQRKNFNTQNGNGTSGDPT
ncbi:MAG TPA: hypothetical protein VF795_12290 [Desulfuromonadaceae bacterium]